MVSVESRVRKIERRPAPKRLKTNVVTTEKLGFRAVTTKTVATDAITPNEAAFGTTVVSDTQPTDYLKEGLTWVDPGTGSAKVYDPVAEDFVEVTAVDLTARASADGKNTIYRQDNEPTGGTYVTGDTWFDSNDNNKIYRYNGTAWVALQLGGNALANINANSVNTGTLNANLITVANLDVGSMTTGNLSASRISSGTISASISITSPTITTGSSGAYIKISTTNANQIQFYAPNQASGYPGLIYSDASSTGTGTSLFMQAPKYSGASAASPYISMSQFDDGSGVLGSMIIHAGSSASGSYILMGAPTYAVNVQVGGTASGSQFTVYGTITAATAVTAPYFQNSTTIPEAYSVARNTHVVTSGISSGGSSSGYQNGAIVLVREA
jgi:hypothetical protein